MANFDDIAAQGALRLRQLTEPNIHVRYAAPQAQKYTAPSDLIRTNARDVAAEGASDLFSSAAPKLPMVGPAFQAGLTASNPAAGTEDLIGWAGGTAVSLGSCFVGLEIAPAVLTSLLYTEILKQAEALGNSLGDRGAKWYLDTVEAALKADATSPKSPEESGAVDGVGDQPFEGWDVDSGSPAGGQVEVAAPTVAGRFHGPGLQVSDNGDNVSFTFVSTVYSDGSAVNVETFEDGHTETSTDPPGTWSTPAPDEGATGTAPDDNDSGDGTANDGTDAPTGEDTTGKPAPDDDGGGGGGRGMPSPDGDGGDDSAPGPSPRGRRTVGRERGLGREREQVSAIHISGTPNLADSSSNPEGGTSTRPHVPGRPDWWLPNPEDGGNGSPISLIGHFNRFNRAFSAARVS